MKNLKNKIPKNETSIKDEARNDVATPKSGKSAKNPTSLKNTKTSTFKKANINAPSSTLVTQEAQMPVKDTYKNGLNAQNRHKTKKQTADALAQDTKTSTSQTNAPQKSAQEAKKFLVEASTWGVEIASCVFIGTLLGLWLDKRFETGPIFLILFFLFGVAAACLNIYRIFQRTQG